MTHKTAATLAIAGGLAASAGAFLPWVTFGQLSSSLISASTQQGFAVAGAGLIAALIALSFLERPLPSLARMAVITGGVVPFLIGLNGIGGATATIAGVSISTSPGIGLLAAIAGGFMAALGGLNLDVAPEPATPGEPPVTGAAATLEAPPSDRPESGPEHAGTA